MVWQGGANAVKPVGASKACLSKHHDCCPRALVKLVRTCYPRLMLTFCRKSCAIAPIEIAKTGLLAGLMAALAACTGPEAGPGSFYAYVETPPPQNNVVTVCHAYECRMRTRVALNGTDIGKLRAIMAEGADTAEAERRAAARAIAWLEIRVAPQVGTARDRGHDDFASANDPSQTDCIDEATNGTSYLTILQQNGLLRHHTVGKPMTRGFIHGQMMHSTAVLLEKDNGAAYAVDSWILPNGKPAIVVPLNDWYRKSYVELAKQAGA